ncbi:ubiquitin carboxyl-terminal hydrolase 16 isoform X1 [Carcharodon carcharias]|uniref:ubiquitin carboxyl-terminal hydrolase 16 isoform X1 n=1 Tax=Carcharodon carcharias TaxID=13397 RepID=UPI001B7DB5DC|nr:ubiquitin carboxyl-terminal hydrolase 16 isoform X1 [Carcharodon carcharias]XP_041067468.1 ubiquitin carboxyl-terminal hydrolase 16 isoform X1 [Carcharodon carcharias]XP_041067469.1 ubiquitin carboxyl-terminal hydrolase 16 isoform X1 [Carcharodon carcharias]XP_041067470.1 ubiquitin carboxyl-terminal hydrolase 16 isoform X1 [Carcharodon carcharias]
MGKKKERQNSPQIDETSDSFEPQCVHVRKGLNLNQIKKQLHQRCWNACEDCKVNAKTEKKQEPDDHPTVWLCLKCGHQGCGRDSEEQHAVKHYEKQHSESHSVVLNLDSWSVWCYLCDGEVCYEVKDQLGQFVAYVQKKTADKYAKGAVLSQTNENGKGKEDNAVEAGKHEKGKTVAQNNQQIPVKGLSNLGNTCFFNAVMQILSQTYVLNELMQGLKMNEATMTVVTPDSLNLGHLEIHLDQPGPLSSAMRQFLLDFQDTRKNVLTPKELFTQVCKKAVRFKGFQQQDSQELLRYLLDGMRTEEIKRIGTGISKALNYSSETVENEESRKTMKVYEKEGSMLNFVDQVFGGTLTSTIMCEECKMVTLVKESFLDLSLPVLDEQSDKKKALGKNGRNTSEDNQNDNHGNCDGNFVSKNRDDVSTGITKYQQKKAKKQAKKQAKNQRQQQKHQAKVLDLENSSPAKCSLDEAQSDKDAACSENKADLESDNIVEEVCPEESLSDSIPTDHCLGTIRKESMEENGQELSQDNTNVNNEEEESSEIAHREKHTNHSHNSKNFDSSDILESFVMNENQFSALCSSEDEENIINNMNELNLNECTVNHDEIALTLEEYKNSGTTNDLLSSAKDKQVVFLDPEKAFCTLTDRELLSIEDCSIGACLRQFTQIEKLIGANKLLCEECTQRQHKNGSKTNANDEKKMYTNARKQMLISSPPPILTLHLKRFQQLGFNLRKINKHIRFPQVLDLAPFCALNCKNVAENCTNVLYSLYGVVEHSGTMRSGHYTAYVKVRTPCSRLAEYVMTRCTLPEIKAEPPMGNWFHISDTRVQAVPEMKVLSAQAYLLFYERIL